MFLHHCWDCRVNMSCHVAGKEDLGWNSVLWWSVVRVCVLQNLGLECRVIQINVNQSSIQTRMLRWRIHVTEKHGMDDKERKMKQLLKTLNPTDLTSHCCIVLNRRNHNCLKSIKPCVPLPELNKDELNFQAWRNSFPQGGDQCYIDQPSSDKWFAYWFRYKTDLTKLDQLCCLMVELWLHLCECKQ